MLIYDIITWSSSADGPLAQIKQMQDFNILNSSWRLQHNYININKNLSVTDQRDRRS